MKHEGYDDQFEAALQSLQGQGAGQDLTGFEHEVWSEIAIRDGGRTSAGTASSSSLPAPALAACVVGAIALGSLFGLSKAQAYDRESSLAVERRYVESIHPVMMSADHSQHVHH